MQSRLAFIVAAALAVTLTACAPSSPEAATAGDAPLESSAPAPAETESDDDGAAEAEDEPSLTAVPLPDTWPAVVPVVDGVIVDAFAVDSGTVFWGARVVPDADLAAASEQARAQLEAAGFTLDGEAENDDGTVNRTYASDEFRVFVNLSTAPGEEGVLYNVQPR